MKEIKNTQERRNLIYQYNKATQKVINYDYFSKRKHRKT